MFFPHKLLNYFFQRGFNNIFKSQLLLRNNFMPQNYIQITSNFAIPLFFLSAKKGKIKCTYYIEKYNPIHWTLHATVISLLALCIVP